jgi:two-component system NtrC family response regulator
MADVLIIDDDVMFSEMLSDMVKRLGHNASRAVDIREGLEKTLSGSFDIVFLDVNLPDGTDSMFYLKSGKHHPPRKSSLLPVSEIHREPSWP